MTPRQERFVAEYLIDSNATKAAIRAGYSPATSTQIASRLLRKVHIAAAVAEGQRVVMQKIAERAVATPDWVIQKAVEVVNRSMEQYDGRTVIAALTLLAKRLPEFRDTSLTVDNRQQTIVVPEGTSLDDLRALRDSLRGNSDT